MKPQIIVESRLGFLMMNGCRTVIEHIPGVQKKTAHEALFSIENNSFNLVSICFCESLHVSSWCGVYPRICDLIFLWRTRISDCHRSVSWSRTDALPAKASGCNSAPNAEGIRVLPN